LKEIACPPDCVFLGAHAGAWEGRETEKRRDILRLAPFLGGLSDGQARLLFLSLVGITSLRSERKDLDDRLLAEAAGALRKTVETRLGGLVYEHHPEDARAEGLVHALKDLFRVVDEDEKPVAPDDRDLLPVLVALDSAVRHTLDEKLGATVFLDSMARLVASRLPQTAPARPLIVAP
jgi:hypothetical protein